MFWITLIYFSTDVIWTTFLWCCGLDAVEKNTQPDHLIISSIIDDAHCCLWSEWKVIQQTATVIPVSIWLWPRDLSFSVMRTLWTIRSCSATRATDSPAAFVFSYTQGSKLEVWSVYFTSFEPFHQGRVLSAAPVARYDRDSTNDFWAH